MVREMGTVGKKKIIIEEEAFGKRKMEAAREHLR